MAVEWLWILALIVIGVVVLAKIIGGFIKALFLALLIVVLITLVMGFVVYSDVLDMKQNIEAKPSLFLMQNSKIITGFRVPFSGSEQEPEFLSKDKLDELNSFFEQNDYDSILGDNYKVFLLRREALDSVEEVVIDDESYSKDFIFQLIESSDPVDKFSAELSRRQGVSLEAVKQSFSDFSDDEFRAQLFTQLVGAAMEQEGPLYIYKEFKEGDISIYKESAVYKFIKMLPLSFSKRFAEVE